MSKNNKKALRHKALRQLKQTNRAKYIALREAKEAKELETIKSELIEIETKANQYFNSLYKSIITQVQQFVNDITIPLQSEFASPDSFIKLNLYERNPRVDYVEPEYDISVPTHFESDKDLDKIEALYIEYAYANGLNLGSGRMGSKRAVIYGTNLQTAMDVTGAHTSPEELFNNLVTKHLRTSRTVEAAFENAQREFEATADQYFYDSDQVRLEEGRKKFGTYVEKGSDIRALMNK